LETELVGVGTAGILGGTFDPVHIGHLIAAQSVLESLLLDKIIFVPCAEPPHKPSEKITNAADRLQMLKIAIASNPAFAVSTIEIDRGGISYSIDTVAQLEQQHPLVDFVLIVGTDAFAEITTWKDYELLLNKARLAVMLRGGFGLSKASASLPARLASALNEAPVFEPTSPISKELTSANRPRLAVVRVEQIEVSGSAVRERLRTGRSVRYLVPEAVREYIAQHGLYRS